MENKRIIICCDGSWAGSAGQIAEPRSQQTNVTKIMHAIASRDAANGWSQTVYYHPGKIPGALARIKHSLGFDLPGQIQAGYLYLVQHYREGDEIYLFGAGRGAIAARFLAGMIGTMGLLHSEDKDKVSQLYRYYRTAPRKRKISRYFESVTVLKRRFPDIRFLGVWDSVGARGIPVPGLQSLSRLWVGLHNSELGQHIRNAYQALAIDEHRRGYKPALWTRLAGQQACEQVWFSGVHTDVTGGGLDDKVSDLALMWMVNRAQQLGLAFEPSRLSERQHTGPVANGQLGHSMGRLGRLLAALGLKPYQRVIGEADSQNEVIHESVIARMLEDHDYRPLNLRPPEPEMYPLVSYAHNRNLMEVRGKEIPIFRERKQARRDLVDVHATLINGDGEELGCAMLDHSDGGGARLQLVEPPSPGSVLTLDSDEFGRQQVTVVWSNGIQMGVKYAA